MTTIKAEIIADSIGEHAPRFTSILAEYPRWIHAEGRTHRVLCVGEDEIINAAGEEGLPAYYEDVRTPSPMEDANLSRNAASSRAIPVERMIKAVLADPAAPLYWGANQSGMQASRELEGVALEQAKAEWFRALGDAVMHAGNLVKIGAHKQIVNRVLEPYSHIKVIYSGTEWSNFFALRLHQDAEPHIRMLAQAMKAAMDASTPKLLQPGEWHLPLTDYDPKFAHKRLTQLDFIKLSVARCASVSYKTVEGFDMTLERAVALHDKLVAGSPMHASPAEHQATPQGARLSRGKVKFEGDEGGNLGAGWRQYRKTLVGERI